MPNIVFVAGDELGKTTAEDRKLIRRHCMLGKNKKKLNRRGDSIDRGGDIGHQRRTDARLSNDVNVLTLPATQYTLSPSLTGTQFAFSLFTFAREIDNRSSELLFKCRSCAFPFTLSLSSSCLYRGG